MNTKTAAEQRIRSLYHYQAFDDLGRLARILTDGAIYCSNPKDFNDPWDCRPCFSKKLLDEPVQYERVVQWFIGNGRRRDPSIRRYHGSLILARPDSSGNLQVQSIGTPFSKDTAKVFDVKGTLRR